MNAKTAGYSGKPLAQKLDIKPGFRVKARHAPEGYREMLGEFPKSAVVSSRLRAPVDIFHAFARTRAELETAVKLGLSEFHPAGMIWASWPKKASGVPTDVSEDVVRDVARG